jgi:hypothetical protein
MPWARWPLGGSGGLPPPLDYNTPWPELKTPGNLQPQQEVFSPSGELLYVMGSSLDGSNDPDNWTAPLTPENAQTDTYESWNPPLYAAKVNITAIANGATTLITAAGHHIPSTGGPFQVTISGVSGNTPSTINGKWWATYVSSAQLTLPLHTTSHGSGGTVGVYCNGCLDVNTRLWTANAYYNYWVENNGNSPSTFYAYLTNASLFYRSIKRFNDGRFRIAEEVKSHAPHSTGDTYLFSFI